MGADPAAEQSARSRSTATTTTASSTTTWKTSTTTGTIRSPAVILPATRAAQRSTRSLSAVSPPYDYVPASDAAYQARLNDIALQIINDLHSPDILMVQEVENQDICTVTSGVLGCGTTDNADGKPDVLQELALKIAANGGPAYDAAFDRDSSDLRGIAPAFLYRTDRVQLLPAAGDPDPGRQPGHLRLHGRAL